MRGREYPFPWNVNAIFIGVLLRRVRDVRVYSSVRDNRSVTMSADLRDHTRALLRNNIMPRVSLDYPRAASGTANNCSGARADRRMRSCADLSTFNETANFLPAISSALMSKGHPSRGALASLPFHSAPDFSPTTEHAFM